MNKLFTADFSLDRYEQDIILSAMSKSQQNVWEAARLLGISPATLDYRQKSAERIKQKADQKNILFSLQGFN